MDPKPVQMTDEVAIKLVKTMEESASASKELQAQYKATGDALGDLKEQNVKLNADITKQLADIKAATDKDATKFREDQAAMQAQIVRLASGQTQDVATKSLGELVFENENFKKHDFGNRISRNNWNVEVDKKNIVTDPASPYTTVPRQRLPGVILLPNQPLLIRDLIPTGQTSSNTIEYVSENVFTNNAGPQSSPGTSPAGIDGAKKNQSDITYTLKTTGVTTLAHFIKTSKQMLSDTGFLSGEIDARLLYGLALKEESELLTGSGINGDLLGLLLQATAFSNAQNVAGDTKIDKVRHSILQCAKNKFVPTGHLMSVDDWHTIETIKDTFGRYLIGDPTGRITPQLWGLPVVASLSMAAGQQLTADFRQAAQIWDRMSISVSVGYENEDFTRNMVTILAEERLALAVYQVKALIYNAAF